ncbi:hypothetical protein, partial [Petrachloros mirabilis]
MRHLLIRQRVLRMTGSPSHSANPLPSVVAIFRHTLPFSNQPDGQWATLSMPTCGAVGVTRKECPAGIHEFSR